jgi:hypothetical protein
MSGVTVIFLKSRDAISCLIARRANALLYRFAIFHLVIKSKNILPLVLEVAFDRIRRQLAALDLHTHFGEFVVR